MSDSSRPLASSPSARKTAAAEAMLETAAPIGAVLPEASRAAAAERFKAFGAPSRRDEYWRFADPSVLTAPAALADPANLPARAADPFDTAAPHTLTFVNGRLSAALSDAGAPEGLEIAPLRDALEAGWATEAIGRLETAAHEAVPRPLAALNGAMALDGVAIRATGRAATAVRIQHLGDGSGAAYARVLLALEPGSEATLLESGLGPERLNTVLEADIGAGARLHHVRLQTAERDAAPIRLATHVFARLAGGAALKSFTLSSGSGDDFARNEHVVWLDGEDGSAHLAGGVIGVGRATLDNTLFLTHAAERCESRQVYKNVAAEEARAIFQGKILVKAGAQKTDGYQISKAVLLDERASFQAKPELEIYADDVVCSHGSTTGALDEDALFYLRARGVEEWVAKSLLVHAFIEEAVTEIADPRLQDVIRADASRLVSGLRPAEAT